MNTQALRRWKQYFNQTYRLIVSPVPLFSIDKASTRLTPVCLPVDLECTSFFRARTVALMRLFSWTLFLSLFFLFSLFLLSSVNSSSRLTSLLLSSTFPSDVFSGGIGFSVSVTLLSRKGELVTGDLFSCRRLSTVPKICISVSGILLT